MYQHEQFKKAREQYAYPPARLYSINDKEHPLPEERTDDLEWDSLRLWNRCPTGKEWKAFRSELARRRGEDGTLARVTDGNVFTSLALDNHHRALLNSNSAEQRLHGLMSTMFWGYASGTDHIIRVNRAKGKARMLAKGSETTRRGIPVFIPPQPTNQIADLLSTAAGLAQEGAYGKALGFATKLTFLRTAFASKVVMFMNPESAAVYDSVIWERLRGSPDPQLRAMAVKSMDYGADHIPKYQMWCEWCQHKADELNRAGIDWRDWDDSLNKWRAVDVERAYFALGRD